MKKALFSIGVFFFLLFANTSAAFSATTPFRSAQIVTTNGIIPYTNLTNCSLTDGLTCDRAKGFFYANLYFNDFGTYEDFGMPENATITKVRIRVTGKTVGAVPLVGLHYGTLPFVTACQFPQDIWRLTQLVNSNTITTQAFVTNVTELSWQPNTVQAYCLKPYAFANNRFTFLIKFSSFIEWSANIDNFEAAFDYELSAPTPTPTPVPPFLDLPWDYEGKGLPFSEAALAINSYFDHEYPLLSSGIGEPVQAENLTLGYDGKKPEGRNYSSHDGYDYGKAARANFGDSVLAAADGTATRGDPSKCGACGNYILIDHGNGYQTRYFHMQDNDLIVNLGESKTVKAGDEIGKVGASGNVIPAGELGAHIHFMVIKDKNNDGDFNNNIPDGVVDPFGWQGKNPDPWANYTFTMNGQQKTGTVSTYLWKKQLDNTKQTVATSGGQASKGKYKIDFPPNAAASPFIVNVVPLGIAKPSNNLVSLGYTLDITATDLLGNAITAFLNAFTLTLDFSLLDTSRIDPASIAIYSSIDGVTWTKEVTNLDFTNKTASATLNHLTHFALMAQRLDTIAPTTTAKTSGERGANIWFSTDVTVSLDAKDNVGGLGVEYTLVKSDNGDWEEYKNPLLFTKEGLHEVLFYSVDADENIENVQSFSFGIDKTPPEVRIDAITSALWLQL